MEKKKTKEKKTTTAAQSDDKADGLSADRLRDDRRGERRDERSQLFYQRVMDLAERFEFNVQIFVAIVAIACLVEIILGWNAFLNDVSMIRGRLKRKAVSYLGVLSRATLNPVLAYDWDQMDLYSRQMFEDEDVVYIRFVDARGQVIFSSLRPSFKERFKKRYDKEFSDVLNPVLSRDANLLMFSPTGLPKLMKEETRRTLINRFNEFVDSVKARFGLEEEKEKRVGALVHYQDSLKGDVDDFSFGIVAITDKRKRTWGSVIVGFNLDAVNDEINGSLYKNLAMTLFFVMLVAVNQYLTRREKLAAKAMADDIAQAKAFFAEIIPKELPQINGVSIAANHYQSPNLGGGFYSVVKHTEGHKECANLVLANAATTGLASSYAASMFEALTLRRLHEEPHLTPKEFVKGVRQDFQLAKIGGSIDMVVIRCERGKAEEDLAIDYVAAGMEPPIVVHEKKDLLEAKMLMRRGGFGISCQGELSVEVGHLKLTKGDRLIVFNDGLSGESELRRFEGEQLRKAILDVGEETAAEAVTAITEVACESYEEAPPDDLITLVMDVTA